MENIFKERLKELREERELNQSQLALESGISQAAIAKWESGDRTPNMYSLIILSKYFGVTTDYMLGLTDDLFWLINKKYGKNAIFFNFFTNLY